MLNIFGGLLLWVLAGVISGIVSLFATGLIPFIVPGALLGLCGGVFHVATSRRETPLSWWLSSLLIAMASMLVTLVVIPDSRYWVIARILIVYYLFFASLLFCFIRYFFSDGDG